MRYDDGATYAALVSITRSTVKGLQALMMQALERGTPLTADEPMKVQEHSGGDEK